MKRFVLALVLAVTSLGAFAQFEEGTKYLNVSLSGLDLSYQKNQFHFGTQAKAGYFFADELMAYAEVGYDFNNIKGDHNDTNTFTLGAGARYYILQNGIYLNLGAKYGHTCCCATSTDNIYLTPEVGYCFYLNHYLSVEPAVYYDMSLNHFSDQSRVGIRLGFGYYF